MRADVCLEFHTFKLFLMIIMRGQGFKAKHLSISVDPSILHYRRSNPLRLQFQNIEASPLNDI